MTKLKSTLETEAGRGYVTIDHYLTARGAEAQGGEGGVVMPSTDPGTGFYDVGGVVATGGMGAIIQAKDRNLERTVAMKIMLDSAAAAEAAIYNFIAEAKITGQLEHPNIVPLHDMGVAADGTIYYTMKLIEGTSLREILQKIRDGDQEAAMRYPLSRLLEIFQKVCDGIAYAHSRRVVHRDLKPDNVMVGAFGEVLVLDWGIAKVLRDTPTHEEPGAGQEGISDMPDAGGGEFATMVGQVKGTPNYMAPEQAEGRVNDIDERTDIYALGGILYTILTLYPPIVGNNVMEILEKVSSGDITAPTAFNQTQSGGKSSGKAKSPAPPVPILPLPHLPEAKIPAALSAVAMKAMGLTKEDRYQDVDELQGEIRRFIGGFATSAEDASALTQIKLMLGRHKKELAIATVFLAIAAGIGVFAIGKVIHSSIVAKKARDAAEQQLAELRATAPTFAAAARAALDQGRFEDALGITNAITFNPANAEYHLLKGHILQSMLKLDEATAAYEQARDLSTTNNPALSKLAEQNRALSNRLKGKKPDLAEFRELYNAMIAQNRIKEASLMSARLGSVDAQLFDTLKRKLVTAGIKGELTRDVNGRLSLDMAGANIASLAALRGIPLAELNIAGCANIDDLASLEGLKLERLDASGTKVNDLSPLRGMPIASLNLAGTKVDDLNPLDKMPLTELNLSNCLAVANIAPLWSISTFIKHR
ncbi:MAG: protein kinase [Verrucomicrobia bacterium]|nr:protein kinase [Verrucomicrobiota bacterium]